MLIHYLNVPYPDDGKVKIPMMPGSVEKKEWTKEELVEQLRPMCMYDTILGILYFIVDTNFCRVCDFS